MVAHDSVLGQDRRVVAARARRPRLGAASLPADPDSRAASADQARLAEYLRDPRRAITDDGVVCLMCGRCFRHLTNTHLRAHGLTSDEYKQRFGYNSRRALMLAAVRRTHAVNANRLGLAGRIRRRPTFENVELRQLGGRHPHALEELLTRRERQPRAYASQPRDGRGRFTAAEAIRPGANLEADAHGGVA